MAAKDGSQARTGHLSSDEPNTRTKRTGRGSGFGPTQHVSGPTSEENANAERKTGRKSGAESVTGSGNLDVEEQIQNVTGETEIGGKPIE